MESRWKLLPFHGGFTLLPLSLVALATGWAGLAWAGLAGWLAGCTARLHSGWLAERITRPRGKARREQARLTLHALGVQPFPLPSRHAKQRQCRLIKQASSQVELLAYAHTQYASVFFSPRTFACSFKAFTQSFTGSPHQCDTNHFGSWDFVPAGATSST